jgi:hypothetical protein
MCSAPGLKTKSVAITVCYNTYAHLKGNLSDHCRHFSLWQYLDLRKSLHLC